MFQVIMHEGLLKNLKNYMNEKIVLKDVHLVASDKKEIIGASVLIKEGKIEDVFYDFSKIKKDLQEYHILDLKWKIVMPAFFDGHISSLKIDPKRVGTLHYLSTFIDEKALGYLSEDHKISERTKGIILNPNRDQALMKMAHDQKLKILLGNVLEEVKKPELEYDGFSNLFFDSLPFDVSRKGLVNLALEERRHYIEIDPCRMSIGFLDFILKSYPRNLIGFICKDYNEDQNLLKAILKARQTNASLMDLVAYTSINPYRFYGYERYTEIKRGKEANLLILNEELELLAVMEKGKFL